MVESPPKAEIPMCDRMPIRSQTETPRSKSAARGAARLTKAKRKQGMIAPLNAGVSISEIAGREGRNLEAVNRW